MIVQEYDLRAHERTLRGAIDSYLKTVARTRPQLTSLYAAQLEKFADAWLGDFQPNSVNSITSSWLTIYLTLVGNRPQAVAVLADFFRWAAREGLIEEPLIA